MNDLDNNESEFKEEVDKNDLEEKSMNTIKKWNWMFGKNKFKISNY